MRLPIQSHSDTPFIRSLGIQLRVIGALLMREVITRYGRDNLGFLWVFVEPMLFTTGITVLWTLSGMHHGSSLPIVAFALTGYSSVLLWRNMPNRCAMAIPPNMGLLYHRNVRVIDIFITRILLEFAGATISFFVLSILYIAIGWTDPPVDILEVFTAWLLLAWVGASLAMTVGALTAYSETVERFWGPVSYLLFPLSGAAFMVEWMPRQFQEWLLLIPMVNAIELLRKGYFGAAVRTHYDIAYVIGFCLVLTLIALLLVKDASRRVEIQ